ncbi:hypothetical protein I6H91_01335 [Micrococcus luteus]|uniref:DUF6361 family protein n=1 Tax=Micrococcus luteus TaxID=1270 RepID=UPI0019112418|nr:DUF6361 family protein [Micrococcus luteus]QQE49015.1 hypothetical protein I6H91_01335 [Micrococcus luteus]
MSSFSWLTVDRQQHRQMMELVDRFRDESTIDDLGFGRIRDAWADRLFPGTSTLHTRLRYALFVPWLLRRAERKHSVEEILADFREGEFQLMDALRRGMGDDEPGIIGRDAGHALRRVPSVVYWGMLGAWGIVAAKHSSRDHAQRILVEREAARHMPVEEHDDGPRRRLPGHLDLGLPEAPQDLLQETTFDLTADEADYLRTMVSAHAPYSLLGHLALNRPKDWTAKNPLPEDLEGVLALDLPGDLEGAVRAAVRFSHLAHLANLLYNVLLAEVSGRTTGDGAPLADVHRAGLEQAWEAYRAGDPFTLRDLEHLASPDAPARPMRPTDLEFLQRWAGHVAASDSPAALAEDLPARRLITEREHRKKRGLARLQNRARLDQWNGGSGLGRLQFRWPVARAHLEDIYRGMEAD